MSRVRLQPGHPCEGVGEVRGAGGKTVGVKAEGEDVTQES
jgi:hypothetical protein